MARLAGLPASVIERAKEILQNLEGSGEGGKRVPTAGATAEANQPVQMALFGSMERKLWAELSKVDVSYLTPIEALNLLHKLSEEAKK